MVNRRTGVFALLLIAILLLAGLPVTAAYAAETVEDRSDCSVTLLLGEGTDHLQDPLKGGTIALYMVAGVHFGSDIYYDVSLGQFSSTSGLSSIRSASGRDLDNMNASLTRGLLKEIRDKKIPPLKTAAIKDGKVSFDGLKAGLYLLCQTKNSRGGRHIQAFILSVPDENGEYQLTAVPKPEIYTPSTPTPKPSPTPESETPRRIPQTGQLWWPAVLFAVIGLGLLALGLGLRARAGADRSQAAGRDGANRA